MFTIGKYAHVVEEARKDFEAGMNWMDFGAKYHGPGSPYLPPLGPERKEYLASPEYKQVQDWEYALKDQQPDVTEPDRDQEPTEYSGRILVRVPKSIHKALVEEAAREGTTLNQLCLAKLARPL